MPTSIESFFHSNWAVAFYVIAVLGICALMLTGGYFLGGRAKARGKQIQFESGVDSLGSARLRFPSKFYLVAMFFVIFDVEALYLFGYAVSVRENGWTGFIEVLVFVVILLIGLFYLVRIGALDWTPLRSNIKAKKKNTIQTVKLSAPYEAEQ